MIILLIILVTVLLFLLGVFVYRYYAKHIAKVDISFSLSCRILLLGFAGCAVLGVIFILLGAALGAAPGTSCEPPLFCLIAIIFGTIGVQSFIYFFMTKSVDGVQITRLHAFILSIIFFLPGLIPLIAGMYAITVLFGDI